MRNLILIITFLMSAVNCGGNTSEPCSGVLFHDGTSNVVGCTAEHVDTGTWRVYTETSMPYGTYTSHFTVVTDFWTDVHAGFVDVDPNEKLVLIEHQGGVVVDETVSIDFEEF